MGRRKIEIQPITHERNRSVTFLKRKNGLFKKAYELGVLCSVDVAVIIFEERAGHHIKLHEYCSTDVDNMVQRHIHFDGEKESKAPHDFNNKPDTGDNDDDEDDDEDNKRRIAGASSMSKSGSGMKSSASAGGRMMSSKPSNSMMGMDMDYRSSMALPQPPLGHLQIPSGGSLSSTSPTAYATSGIPVSLVRNTPNDGMPSSAKRQRLDSSASSSGYGENPYALHGADSPASYGLSAGIFPQTSQRQGSGGNPASPTSHQFGFTQGMAGFPRTGSSGGSSRGSFPSGGGAGSYSAGQPPLYNPSNPFASLIGSTNSAPPGSTSSASPHGHGHVHHPGTQSFEPLDWPVHNSSSSGQQSSTAQQQQSSSSSERGGGGGGPSSASPHPQSQSQQGFPPRPGATASGGGNQQQQESSWLDFLSSTAPPPGSSASTAAGAGAESSRPGSVASGGGGGGAGRRIEDSYERGMSGLSPSQQMQRSRSDSSVKEEAGVVVARAGSVNSLSDASRPSANGGLDVKDGLDIKSDVS